MADLPPKEIAEQLARLPDSAPVYVPGVGEVTIGAIRSARTEPSADDELEATYRMWEDIATRNLCRAPGQPYVPISEIKAHHAARYHSGRGG